MQNKTNKTIDQKTKSFLNWDTSDIFDANFMFPTKHFTDEQHLKSVTYTVFCELIEEMLTPCLPLTNMERSELSKSVKSDNRLRVYFQTTKLVERALKTVNDLQTNDSEISSLEEKDLIKAFEQRGIQVFRSEDNHNIEVDDQNDNIKKESKG